VAAANLPSMQASPRTRPIEAVIFDYGGVLSTAPFAGLADFEEEMGYPKGSIARLLFGESRYPGGNGDAAQVEDWHRLETGQLPLDEFNQRLVDRSEAVLGTTLDLGFYRQFLDTLLLGTHWMVVHRVRELRAEGYRTAILTNNIKEWGAAWRSTIPIDDFDVVIDSCEVGLRKPDPAIFLLTCERLGVAPEAAVFLDDTRRHVAAARKVGLAAILVSDPVEALVELDAILAGGPPGPT
jgi:putative hydrolase of the HAD superfamily